MRTRSPLWIILVACTLALTLFGCKMQLKPTNTTKVWCCATCTGYTKPVIQVAFLDHRGDGIPDRRIYITTEGPLLEYARDAQGAPLPRNGSRNNWMYFISGKDGRTTITFDMPPNLADVPGLAGKHSLLFRTYMEGQPDDAPLTSKTLQVTVGDACK